MQLWINNWSAALLQPVSAESAMLEVDPSAAARLSGLGAGDHYLLTLIGTDELGNEIAWEIVRVTAAVSGSLTIERGQEGSAAMAWPSGAAVEMRITAGAMSALRDTPGPAGPAGEQGVPGLSAYGVAVAAGFIGDESEWLTSLRGDDGQDGADGASAYDVAVAAGFVGDQAAWIASLKGAQGDPGEQGPEGPAGPTGSGLQIIDTLASTDDLPVSGSAGDGYLIDGHLWVWGVGQWIDAGLIQGPQGPAGPTGPVGAPGAAGADGASAYQIALANGFTGSEVEWLASLQGAQGPVGPTGPAGADGEALPAPVVTAAATSITLALSDAGQYLRPTSASAVTVTVAPQSSVAWQADTEIHIEQGGSGAVTIAGGADVTVNRLAGTVARIAGQYGVVALKRVGENVWTLFGALEESA